MGLEIEVNSLEEMCDLMCNNKLPDTGKKPRTVDRTKKSNIKCEHCEYWREAYLFGRGMHYICVNPKSSHFQERRKYYHRCMFFEWKKTILDVLKGEEE